MTDGSRATYMEKRRQMDEAADELATATLELHAAEKEFVKKQAAYHLATLAFITVADILIGT